MKMITEYFRNAVAASNQKTHEYKEGKFCTISGDELYNGFVGKDVVEFIKKISENDKQKKDTRGKEIQSIQPILIALKTVVTDYKDGVKLENNVEEMVSILFLPANVTKSGQLNLPNEGKLPWIPREYLEPIEDPLISIGMSVKYDEYLEQTTDIRNQIDSWDKYLDYAIRMYEFITNTSFNDHSIISEKKHIKLDGKYYLFLDTSIYTIKHIMALYNELRNSRENKLYARLTNGIIEPTKKLIPETNIEKMKIHVGQMNGEYPLSPSQREAIHHFDELEEGEILAVSGPPGTGKTTLLQSVVANMFVSAALNKKDAPIIVATSSNNQAVTNIIDSFGKINVIGISNLEKKWITGTNSFATYFPSFDKEKNAVYKHYQYTSVNGGAFIDDLESSENREKARKLFLKEYTMFVGKEASNLTVCLNTLWKKLYSLNQARISCLTKLEDIKRVIGEYSYSEYVEKLRSEIQEYEAKKKSIQEKVSCIKNKNQSNLTRCNEWRESYNTLAWYIRVFKFVPHYRNKIVAWSFSFIKDNELSLLKRDMTIEEIEKVYRERIFENDRLVLQLMEDEKIIMNEMNSKMYLILEIEEKLNKLKSMILDFDKYHITLLRDKDTFNWNQFDVLSLNNLLDIVRYAEFWLAVHYYECRWLSEKNPISVEQKGSTFENVLNCMYHRLAMISPCMVMTFLMLPKQFYAYSGNDKRKYHMYNYIDLLIVDEAGQTSPEIAAASFSLAKKAIVVGDEEQIPPVWGTVRALDIAMAKHNKVIRDKDHYIELEKNGLNCSQSSIMKVASLSCAYNKHKRGLFLSEHRRCYDEIVSYCNRLVYDEMLEPKRGGFYEDRKNNLFRFLPPMGHKQIISLNSQKIGTSRCNQEEARQIVSWLKDNFQKIKIRYMKSNDKELVGIITPFKSQKHIIEKLIIKEMGNDAKYIDVGTVHAFQGAERKIIIFSSVYGSKDGCYFINQASNLMNVAVSRAKDSFIIFGDRDCLSNDEKSASGLLKRMTETSIDSI